MTILIINQFVQQMMRFLVLTDNLFELVCHPPLMYFVMFCFASMQAQLHAMADLGSQPL